MVVLYKSGNTYTEGAGKAVAVSTKIYDLPSAPSADYSGLAKYNGKTYCFVDGKIANGWQTVGNEKYYFDDNFTMHTGWLTVTGGAKYFFGTDGKMAKDIALKIDGKTYDFDVNGKATERKASTSSSSSYTTNTTPGDFKIPKGGEKKDSVFKNCGIANVYDLGDNHYGGKVMFLGEISTLILDFNSNDECYAYALVIPMSYAEYELFVDAYKKGIEHSYTYNNGIHMWTGSGGGISLFYDSNESSAFMSTLYFDYAEN
ncbi:MAG: hypothetical protein NC078_09890 [Ruminococcus sp.]|nr:hypothetical protein [Ruminococcus sp.]